jgi:hypothetical protein
MSVAVVLSASPFRKAAKVSSAATPGRTPRVIESPSATKRTLASSARRASVPRHQVTIDSNRVRPTTPYLLSVDRSIAFSCRSWMCPLTGDNALSCACLSTSPSAPREPVRLADFHVALFRDDLEDVAVDIPEKEAGERRRPLRLDQLRALLQQPAFQPLEIRSRKRQRDMSAELRLERRRLEVRDLDQVQLLARRDLEPGRWPADVVGPRDGPPAQGLGEERGRGADVAGGQGEVGPGP